MKKIIIALVCIVLACVIIAIASNVEDASKNTHNTAIPMPQRARMPKVKNNT